MLPGSAIGSGMYRNICGVGSVIRREIPRKSSLFSVGGSSRGYGTKGGGSDDEANADHIHVKWGRNTCSFVNFTDGGGDDANRSVHINMGRNTSSVSFTDYKRNRKVFVSNGEVGAQGDEGRPYSGKTAGAEGDEGRRFSGKNAGAEGDEGWRRWWDHWDKAAAELRNMEPEIFKRKEPIVMERSGIFISGNNNTVVINGKRITINRN